MKQYEIKSGSREKTRHGGSCIVRPRLGKQREEDQNTKVILGFYSESEPSHGHWSPCLQTKSNTIRKK